MSQKTYKIGDVAKRTGIKPFVLRFWETEFPQLVPIRTPKGQRAYTDAHIALLNRIKTLLYEEKLTIDGARRRLAEKKPDTALLREIYAELTAIRRMLQD